MHIPPRAEGRTRRHERGGGLRWTWKLRWTSAAGTDGEVVWSWPPGAEAKFVMLLTGVVSDRGKKAGP
jgi:hypothetical protein